MRSWTARSRWCSTRPRIGCTPRRACWPGVSRRWRRLSDGAPLILTLRFDEAHQALFDRLRGIHFPPDRNHLAAHVTLFHALPGGRAEAIRDRLASIAAQTAPPDVEVEGVNSLGGGVAFRLRAPSVEELRGHLALGWAGWLTSQDRAKRGLHVTVQNKVRPAEAKALLAELAAAFSPSLYISPALDLWLYRGGPWEHAAEFRFAGG